MPHYFNLHCKAVIEAGLYEIDKLREIKHPGIKGRIKEIFVARMLQEFSPSGIKFTSGKIIDKKGNESSELDVIVYSDTYMPTIMIDSGLSLVPIEACYYVFEVKSKITKNEIKDAIAKFKNLREMSNPCGLHTCLFGFDSDVKKGKELERYKEIDTIWSQNSLCNSFVSPKQYFYVGLHPDQPESCWTQGLERKTFSYICKDFLTGYCNTLIELHKNRLLHKPVFGEYLSQYDEAET
ncbi:MAG: hypothetical protein CMH27_09545 [Micavibrio sp.]|nr:hypothetical protein [Micavibrio sp.]|tara:strand:+ start:755 stop:1468 length:714 start_codon:yes stop_codon:yes gene_type:complete